MDNHLDEQGHRCAEYGAPMIDGLTCWEQLRMLLNWEAQDAALAAEHFLTVASYNLQHPAQFTDEALAGLPSGLSDYLEQGFSTEELRRRAAGAFAGSKRVLKDPSERQPVFHQWSMTIADVCLPDQPHGAAERVRAWAAAIRWEQ